MIVNTTYDFAASFVEIRIRFSGFVDEDEVGFFVDAKAVEKFTRKTAFFDEPAGINFEAVGATVDWIVFFGGDFGFGFGKVNVFEERAGTGSYCGIGEFVGANGGDNGANSIRREVG